MTMRNRDVAIGVGLLLLAMSKRKAAASSFGKGGGTVPQLNANFASAWASRATALLKRSHGGDAWVARMTTRLKSPEAGAAAGRWIGIESGGDPRNKSSLNERGLAQVSKQSLKELGLTEADFAAMESARTTDDEHADMAAVVMGGELIAVARGGDTKATAPGWGPALGPAIDIGKGRILTLGPTVAPLGIGVAKLRHGLPLLVKELRDQGHLRTSIPLTIRSALVGSIGAGTPLPRFKPSTRLAAFGGGLFKATGDPAQDLLLRFLCSAAVVAHGEAAIPMGGAFNEAVS